LQIALQQAQEEKKTLENALKTTKLFLSMVVHDLRTPTSQIELSIKMALDKMEPNNEMNS